MQLGFLESGERKITFYSSGGIGQNPADPSSEIFGDAINQAAKRAQQLVYVFLCCSMPVRRASKLRLIRA